MHPLPLSLKGEEQHGEGHGHNDAVEHDLGIDALNNNADDHHREEQHQNPAHGLVGIFAVAAVADEHQNHLAEGDEIAQHIQPTAAVDACGIKIEQQTGPRVGKHHPTVKYQQHCQPSAGVAHAVVIVGVLQNFGKQEKSDAGGGNDVQQKIQAVAQHVQPKGCFRMLHQFHRGNIDEGCGGGEHKAVHKIFAGLVKIGPGTASLQIKQIEYQHQRQGKKITDVNHVVHVPSIL